MQQIRLIKMNTDLHLIVQLLKGVIPDDISNKILLLLLGVTRTPCANCFQSAYNEYLLYKCNASCGNHYEIKPQQTKTQELVMCEIRIAQFDRDCNKKKAMGAIKTIKMYMKLLEVQFRQRHLC